MQKLTGKLTVATESEVDLTTQELIKEINKTIDPPEKIDPQSVYIGVLYAASDQVNMQGGCFAEPELKELVELVTDAPVMVGHKKQELPIGRVFKGEIVYKKGAPWLKAYFYWSRKSQNADELKANIDAGIYKECSLGFLYGKPECAICRQDIRNCRHRIHEVVNYGGREIKTFFYYKEIQKVLEVSLVYRGAVEGTKVTTISSATKDADEQLESFWRSNAQPIFDLRQINTPLEQVVIEPLYNGIWLEIKSEAGKLTAITPDGKQFTDPLIDDLRSTTSDPDYHILCQLLPVRGASRLPLRYYYDKVASGQSYPRCKLLLVDIYTLDGQNLRDKPLIERKDILAKTFTRTSLIAVAPYFNCKFIELGKKISTKGTADGMLIIDCRSSQPRSYEYRRKLMIKGVVNITEDADKDKYFISFKTPENNTPAGMYRLITNGHNLADGDLVWVKPTTNSDSTFEYWDHCQRSLQVDTKEVACSLLEKSPVESFDLFIDNHGNSWLDLHFKDRDQLLRIAKLGLILLQRGRKFWCRFLDINSELLSTTGRVSLIDSGRLMSCQTSPDGAVILNLEGDRLRGQYKIEPSHFGNEQRFLFFQEKT